MSSTRYSWSLWHLMVLVAGLLALETCSAGEDRSYWQHGLELAQKGEKIFVANGICSSAAECQKKQLLFLQPVSAGIEVAVYGIADSRTLEQLTALCMQMFYEVPGANVSFKAFSESKQEIVRLPFWKSASPIVVVNFSRRT